MNKILLLLLLFPALAIAQPDFEETKALAEAGVDYAQHNLGFMYATGDGVPKNMQEAIKWYLLAADQGQPDSQNNLGKIYYNGEGVRQSYEESYSWYMNAALQGISESQYFIGNMHNQGHGVKQDYRVAHSWFELAAKQGHPLALLALGAHYFMGQRKINRTPTLNSA